jgi:hypothetical protein
VQEPLVRARHLKATLGRVDLAPQRQAVLGQLPAGYLAQVEAAYGGDWLPVTLDVVLARAIRASMSPAEHHAFCVAAVRSSFDGPILRALTQTALAVLGLDLRRMAHWIPKGWGLTFQHVGRWAVQPDPERPEIHLSLSGLPEVCMADEVWAGATASSLSALCDLAGASGRVRLLSLDRPSGRADYLLRWEG